MKLLLYSHYFAPSIGGVETVVMSLAHGLAETRSERGGTGIELTVVTRTAREPYRDDELAFRVIRKPCFWQLLQLILKSDVVHIAGPALTPLIIGLLTRKPVVVEQHGFQVICPTGQLFIESRGEPCPGHFMAGNRSECWNCDPALGWFGARKLWLLTFVRRWLCGKASANVMPTQWLGTRLDLPHATTIHHGLVPIVKIAGTPGPTRIPLIAFQGRLVTTKGARVLLEAARILFEQKQEFEVVFIGDGPEKAGLQALAQVPPLAERVRFTGRLGQTELEAVLRQASIVVVPSLGGEVFGMVVAENMQRGLPVLASDLGSLAEVLGDSGITFRTGDRGDLAKKILELLQSSKRREEIGVRAKERAAQSFTVSKMIREHRLLYEKILSEKS